jgi:hypothetical protein
MDMRRQLEAIFAVVREEANANFSLRIRGLLDTTSNPDQLRPGFGLQILIHLETHCK